MSELLPCPFCGDKDVVFERMGTSRVSCIVRCENCGCKLETGEEGLRCGKAWNRRHTPEGFVLVPVEPTEDMEIAGFESEAWDELGDAAVYAKGWPYTCRESAECVNGIYKAMIKAAQAERGNE